MGSILVNCSNIGYRFDRIKNINGLMLIDEIENHLHVELQKSIVKVLMETFPNIQFIFSTHSPVVLSATENILVYDVLNNTSIDDLIEYSIDRIVNMYFEVKIENASLWAKYTRLRELVRRIENDDDIELYRDDIEYLMNKINNMDNELTPRLNQKVETLVSRATELIGDKNV